MTALRVLIIAADPLARAGLAALMAVVEGATVAGQSAPSDDFAFAVDAYRPDVALWDAGWNSDADTERIRLLVERGVPVLLLVAELNAVGGLWATGAGGLLDRSATGVQIVAALNAVRAGLHVMTPQYEPPAAARDRELEALVEPLTPREMDVLGLMANGLSNKLIARDLGISEHTVKFHVNSILAKLGAQSRTDAVVRATRMGVLLL